MATTKTSFVYSLLWSEAERHSPDPNNPVVFRMWKLQGSEPLVSIGQRYRIHYTNAPIYFDLLSGQLVPEGGDIRITVSRSPGILSARNRGDWGIKVEAIAGGLMSSEGLDNVTFQAPETGYQASADFLFSTNAPNRWFSSFTHGFFLQSRNGQVHAKVGLTFVINEQPDAPMQLRFSGAANTNRSRNWEATAPH